MPLAYFDYGTMRAALKRHRLAHVGATVQVVIVIPAGCKIVCAAGSPLFDLSALSALCIQEYMGALTRHVRLIMSCTEASFCPATGYGELCRRMQLTAARVRWSRVR